MAAGRYHSLMPTDLPEELEVSATMRDVVMACATASCRRRGSSSTPSRCSRRRASTSSENFLGGNDGGD